MCDQRYEVLATFVGDGIIPLASAIIDRKRAFRFVIPRGIADNVVEAAELSARDQLLDERPTVATGGFIESREIDVPVS